MNQLRRMVLVNSAKVRYREVELDGHIHFIGTQGTGKSTLLRAILYFYNAESRKLGISKEKKSFAEYYFPYADSYIFYEVQTGARRFCVWLYKRNNKLCFRFVDGGYDRALALEGKRARSETELMAKAVELGFKVERAIYNRTDYRDILYGENRAMRRYALMQNTQSYSTIPRTISNIFLNANLDGDYIKKTIIDSLSDDSVEINLETNRHHLETARNHYEDVMEYQRNEAQAEQIVSAYAAVVELEERQRESAWKIGAAFNRARGQVRVLDGQIAEESKAEQQQREKLKAVRDQFDTEKRRIDNRLAGVKKDIARANKLTRDYAEMGIEALLEEAQKASQLEQELKHCHEQLRVLTAQVEQQEQQFEIAAQKLENECHLHLQQTRAELSDFKDHQREELDAARKNYEKQMIAIDLDYEENSGGYHISKSEAEHTLKELEFELRGLDNVRFFKDEQKRVEECGLELERQLIRMQATKQQMSAAIEAQQREAEDRQKMAKIEGENTLRPLTDERQVVQARLMDRNAKLDALNGSLLEFLDDQVEGWGKTIGKVVSSDVLLHSGLNPQKCGGGSLYGMDLNLEHLPEGTLSKTGLQEEISLAEKAREVLAKKIEKQLTESRAAQDRLLQQYNRKLRELQDSMKTASMDIFKLERELERNQLAQQNRREKEDEKRAEQQRGLEEKRYKICAQVKELAGLITDLMEKKAAEKKRINTDFNRDVKGLKKGIQQRVDEAEQKMVEQQRWLKKQQDSLYGERAVVLQKEGVDAQKVATLENQESRLKYVLQEIRKNEKRRIFYEKDKCDWIDKLPEFQRERGQLENKLAHQVDRFEHRIRQEQEQLCERSTKLKFLQEEHQRMSTEVAAFEKFEREDIFVSFKSFICHHDQAEEANCGEWISELQNLAWKFEKQFKKLTERITALSGRFSEGNCLGFEVHLVGEAGFRTFAETLAEFVREQKIITLKTEVTRKYSMVLEAIVNETNRLLQREGEVHRVIHKINGDFRNSNFVGVVRSIEMRLQESGNRIFQVLREICQFQTENHMSFGELDLFNRGDSGHDEKAVELLDQLRVQMGQSKNTKLKLEDALDLEFRICENENDTNWVSSLANVGSNGTDVLVKSMIYINLLNIFKTGTRKQSESTRLHCLVDEVGILHDSNVASLINFAAERGICMINGSPNSHNEQDYKHIYIFKKDEGSADTTITKLLSHAS